MRLYEIDMRYHPKLAECLRKFEARVCPEPNTGCYLWMGAYSGDYGKFAPSRALVEDAHRWAWRLYRGPIPPGLCVLHRCDTPICVNVDHLYLGTHQVNMADRDAKGRQARGERQGNADLTEAVVREIFAAHGTLQEIADAYGVCQSTVFNIKRGKSWKHLKLTGDFNDAH